MKITLDNRIRIDAVEEELELIIKERLTLPNPKYEEASKYGRRAGQIAQKLKFYTKTKTGLALPRGFLAHLHSLLEQHGVTPCITDQRRKLPPVDLNFSGELKALQIKAVQDLATNDFGVLHVPTGGGKTVMALWLTAHRKQPALVVVHTRELMNQWIMSIENFLKIPAKEIGMIGQGQFKIGQAVTVATIQTLIKHGKEVSLKIGNLILDECHRAPAMQYITAIKEFDSQYMTGLTATPIRRDGMSQPIFWHIGEISAAIEKSDLLKTGNLCNARVLWVITEFETNLDVSLHYSTALSQLTKDHDRNHLICDTISRLHSQGISLVLTDRKEHGLKLCRMLNRKNHLSAQLLTGSTSGTKRIALLKELRDGTCRILVATGQLIGEGFDLPEMSTLFLTTPIKFSGRLIQYMGRVLRPALGKSEATLVDFVDNKNPVFKASATSRFYTYQNQGITSQSRFKN